MNSFQDDRVLRQSLTPALVGKIRTLGEYKGKQQLWRTTYPEILEKLRDIAVIQSTESSNRIEGVTAPLDRIRELLKKNTQPANRSEEEIAGYRDVLNTIHTSHEAMKITSNLILQLHRDLYKFSPERAGHWKTTDNEIADVRSDGTKTIRFRCVSAMRTPEFVERLCVGFNRLRDQEAIDPLLLIPAFILDFLCIHPFRDGNGRLSRLLTLLLFYQAGYEVGKYVSLERIIEDSKESYYESLKISSEGWHEGLHSLLPWRDYLLGVFLASFNDLEQRTELVNNFPGAKRSFIREAVNRFFGDFTSRDLELACPSVSREMIRVVLRELQTEGKLQKIGDRKGSRWRKIE